MLAYLGVQNLRHYLVGFAARKALLENVERNLHKGNENIHCRSGAGGNFRTPVRFGSLADISAAHRRSPLCPQERTCSASTSMSSKCQKQTSLSGPHRQGGY